MRSVKEADVRGKRVLVRVDFNVPLRNNRVANSKRILAALPTISLLQRKGAKIILMSHVGRPDGRVVETLRTKPIARYLQKLVKKKVYYVHDCIGNKVKEKVNALKNGEILVLENLRFYKDEKNNKSSFAKKLASLAEVYVNDAFGACHRKHASVVAITKYLPSYAGLLVEKEVKTLSSLLKNPKRPFIAILGGAKISSKIGMIKNLLKKVDAILIGGAMAFPFLKSLGYEIGKSKTEKYKTLSLLKKAKKKIMLPVDFIAASSIKAKGRVVDAKAIPKGVMGLDIGPETSKVYAEVIKKAKTVFWNGPMGVSEVPAFSKGTRIIAKAIANNKGRTIAGGGDSIAVIEKLRLEGKFSHVSTGGGASLEFIEGKTLPGITALKKSKRS